jgi:hypothetical protein
MKQFKSIMLHQQMTPRWQGGLMALVGTAIATSVTLATPSTASAQAAYGSYIGAGVSFGLTSGDDGTEPRKTAGVIAGRYKFLRAPISIRTQAMIGNGVAIVPTISYDIPINWRTDVYLGAGASFPLSGDTTTPVGNQTAFAIQPGIDYVLPNSNAVLFGNAVIAFNAYRTGGGTAAALQAGVGWRF